MSNETIKDQVRRLISGIAPCYEKRPDLIKDDDYCFGFMVQVVELAIAEEREAAARICERIPRTGWKIGEESWAKESVALIRQRAAPKDEVSE